jgi:hypothetical protein
MIEQIWQYALNCIEPSCGGIQFERKSDFHFFYLLYILEQNSKSTKQKLSVYQKEDTVVGKGNQGTVNDVIGHPDKVMKSSIMFKQRSYDGFIKTSRIDRLASEEGFGPKIYEISLEGEIIDIQNPPKFKERMVFDVVMEKIDVINNIDALEYYIGIVNTWKLMRKNKIFNADGFIGISPTRDLIVSADYGVTISALNDEEFIEALDEYIETSIDFSLDGYAILEKFSLEFSDDEFTVNIAKPVLDIRDKAVKKAALEKEKKRIQKEKKESLKLKIKAEKEIRKEENDRIKASFSIGWV